MADSTYSDRFLRQFALTATPAHLATYLLIHCLFSISFLVFLNSSLSFVITDRLGIHHRVGDAVGTLGFVDELVALIACPLWGVLSDRVGVRNVAAIGFALVGAGLWAVIACKNVIPGLFLARILFASGGSATSTMVTAILPTLTYKTTKPAERRINSSHARTPTLTPSISSQITITPVRFATNESRRQRSSTPPTTDEPSGEVREGSTSQLAGLVGIFTGLGALLALGLFLPLPARFQRGGYTPAQAVANAFWIVGAVALAVAALSFIGLSGLPGEDNKGIRRVWHWRDQERKEEDAALASGFGAANTATATNAATTTVLSYPALLYAAVKLGLSDADIGLAYIGGLVARASSVGISLFIPLFVDQYFISSGRCKPGDVDLKHDCRQAYILAAALTGVAQFIALLCAPLFGWLGSQAQYRDSNLPLLLAAAAGVAGNTSLARLKSPDFHEKGNGGVWAIVILIGISQIGAIVCSLALLGRGIQSRRTAINAPSAGVETTGESTAAAAESDATIDESAPLLQGQHTAESQDSRVHLKGSVAGVYSLSGGAGILILTKLGGWAADKDPGAPFIIMAVFNAILLVAGCSVWIFRKMRR